jgi:hypothetical protein
MTETGDEFRDLEVKQKIKDAVNDVTHLLASHDWERAKQRLESIQREHADSLLIMELSKTVAKARKPHKEYLIRRFLKASEQDNPEEAMELLKELDHFLTSDEAVPLAPKARHVIQSMRENLSLRFKMAVNAQDWTAAKYVAELIISDFGNTRMAKEVLGKMDLLRERSLKQRLNADQI